MLEAELRDLGEETCLVGDVDSARWAQRSRRLFDVQDEITGAIVGASPAASTAGCGLGVHELRGDTDRVDVAAGVVRLSAEHELGRQEARRAHDDALGREPVFALGAPAGEAEVDELHLPRLRHHDVRGLDVAMDDVSAVRGGQTAGHGEEERHRFVGGQAAEALQPAVEALPIDELHGQVLHPVGGDAEVVDGDHARMLTIRNRSAITDPISSAPMAQS